MNSLTEENYLKALFNLSNTGGEVNVKELSETLDIKMPTVTSMMKRLAQKHLVYYESYKPLRLTEEGRREAALIIRKHRLMEMFLVEKMGFGWQEVHEIAEQIEHIHSPAFFEKMDEMLGYPTIDPHGSPIPDRNGKMVWKQYSKLSDCKKGDRVKLAAVLNSSVDFLNYLTEHELKLGVELKVLSIEVFDGTMRVNYLTKKDSMLSKKVTDLLLVETLA